MRGMAEGGRGGPAGARGRPAGLPLMGKSIILILDVGTSFVKNVNVEGVFAKRHLFYACII
jgi:hypothetical protein